MKKLNQYTLINKLYVLIPSVILLVWFFLDMVGFNINGKPLVEEAFKDDFIFFAIYVISILSFVLIDKIGRWVLSGWLFMWFVTQFFSHWYLTITGTGLKKIEYFKNTIKLFENETRYIADLYHIILHILILVVFSLLIVFIIKSLKEKKTKNEK